MPDIPRSKEPDLFDEPGIAVALGVTLAAMFAFALAIAAITLFLGWRHTPQLSLVVGPVWRPSF
jgi:hypothetical protein